MEFEQGCAEGWAALLNEHRQALPEIDPSRYRGMDRTPLERWFDGLDELVGTNQIDERDIAARRFIRGRLGPDPTLTWRRIGHFDADLLPTTEVAFEVRSLAEQPSDWEVIAVTRQTADVTGTTLGFDVGYWGMDHCSFIRDTAVAPEYRPPPPEDFCELQAQVKGLNDHLLFNTAHEAEAFRAWYRSKVWAEAEDCPDEFQILRIESVAPVGV